jgi:hypothetical protein
MRCQARIVKEFKSRKADVCWSECASGPCPDNVTKYPECGGNLTVKIVNENEPYYGGTDTVMRVHTVCTRCKMPYFDGILKMRYIPPDGFDLTPYLERGL